MRVRGLVADAARLVYDIRERSCARVRPSALVRVASFLRVCVCAFVCEKQGLKKSINSLLTVIVEIWYNMRRSHGKGESAVLIAN